MKNKTALANVVAAVMAFSCEAASLFNGKDLSGWTESRDHNVPGGAAYAQSAWTVCDGAIRTTGEPFGYLRTQKADYADFKLRLEYRWWKATKKPNSGVFVRLASETGTFLPNCYENQLWPVRVGDVCALGGAEIAGVPPRNPFVPGEALSGIACAPAKASGAERPFGEWNTLEIEVKGDEIANRLNGIELNRVKGIATPRGAIALQSEGGAIEFRNIELTEIEPGRDNAAKPGAGTERSRMTPAKEELFGLDRIHLAGGPLQYQQEQNRQYLLKLEPDRMLSRFRSEAGLKPKAPNYNGWESPKCWLDLAGHILGFYMSGAAMTVEATGDEELKRRLLYIVDELAEVQKAHGDGYALAAKNGRKMFQEIASGKIDLKFNSKTEYCAFVNGYFEPVYTMNKLLLGLGRIHEATGSEKAKQVYLGLMDWFGTQVIDKLDDASMQKLLDCEHGSLPETFADAYFKTGEEKYRRWARRLCHERMLAPLAEGRLEKLDFHHGNNEIPKFTGFERVYRATGEERLHRSIVNAWRAFVERHAWANGGNTHREHLFPEAEFETKMFQDGGMEACNSVNMLRQTEALFQTEPSVKKIDYYENVLFNHLLATHEPLKCRTAYYMPSKPGASKTYSHEFESMWCCTGTGFEAPGKYAQMIFTHAPDDGAVSVQLFAPAVLEWKERGARLRQETAFPYGETSCVKIEEAGENPEWTLKVRKPGWADGRFAVYVNGEKASGAGADGYVAIRRRWRKGDRVDIEFPMTLRSAPLKGSGKYVAFFYGPVLLAGDMGSEGLLPANYIANPASNNRTSWKFGKPMQIATVPAAAKDDPGCCLERVAGSAILFHLKDSEILLKPIFDLYFSRYNMYWQLKE